MNKRSLIGYLTTKTKMQKIKTESTPIKMWLNDIEDSAMEQIVNLANLQYIHSHVAIMPDCHAGYGMPIGGVIATKGVISPNCVGVDIGCGMCAVQTSLKEITQEQIKKIFGGSKENQGGIRAIVPVGFNKHSRKQDERLMPDLPKGVVVEKHYNNALKSLGTLGGGNHFIEIQKGSDGYIWIMIHSGSRNLGLQVAKYYNDIAKKLDPENAKNDLAFLRTDSKEGHDYIQEMEYCVEYALRNRKLMMKRVQLEFAKVFEDIDFDSIINIAHNYASFENHFGADVWVHRKGATSAKKGEVGIIPGSQGTKSYIVEGLGNKESFNSCSHGAGRVLSRKKAKEILDIEKEKSILDSQGIIHSIRSVKDLDEAPSAYKNIDEVMDNQKDLVKIKVELTPLAVIKG